VPQYFPWRHFVLGVSKNESFLCTFARHFREVKTSLLLRPLYNSLFQSYATVSVHHKFNLGIKYVFQLYISIEYFQFINNDQWLLPNQQSTISYVLFRRHCWVSFFQRASIGDFIFLHMYTSTSGGVKCSYTERSCTSTYRGI
jgi:hypothetical protein